MRVDLVFIFVYNIAFLLIYVCIEMNLTDDFRDLLGNLENLSSLSGSADLIL